MYAFYLSDKDKDEVTLPGQVKISQPGITKKISVVLLGSNEKLKWKLQGNDIIISVPPALQNKSAGKYAAVFRISN